ncbi:hypothetical protein [Croceivirga sp. JEA036]|uniref:hypothetical protein n=1 Tax=Croceivirga sp. JEA036 TaxID=2721162 RepID=UPI001439D0D6|nr:hypothetical protein [Croceivirga sp. JEA036]NJB36809.1 hypothetical protein [Croceivirga sp. JEA036]
MAKEKNIAIKEVELTNNCPECYNQLLKLTFYQKHTYNAFFHRITSQISHEIKCKTCYSMIYPVNWTEDIERVFEYYNKLATPEKKATKPTTLTFVLITLAVVAVGVGTYFLIA